MYHISPNILDIFSTGTKRIEKDSVSASKHLYNSLSGGLPVGCVAVFKVETPIMHPASTITAVITP